MKRKVIIALILGFIVCLLIEFAVNGLSDFHYLAKLMEKKFSTKEVVKDEELEEKPIVKREDLISATADLTGWALKYGWIKKKGEK